jgi:flagellar motility protein MotE (MotC chaperone)
MKKFELRNLINEIVQRKLNDARSQIADTVNKIASEGEIKDVKIMTHYGSHDLEVVEVFENNGVLYFSINTDSVEQNETIQEIGEVGAMGIASPESGMKDSDKRSLATYQAALDKFTNDITKIDSDVAKLQEPVQKKIETLERKKASLSKKQGQVIDRINSIKNKQ